MNTTTESLTVDQFIRRSPDRVWRALTTPADLEEWWAPGDIAPIAGHHFMMEMPGWGKVACEVLEAVEPERLVYTFADWTLTWTLAAEAGGTRLTLVQSGFDLSNPQHKFAFENMGSSWRSTILPRLASLVESDD